MGVKLLFGTCRLIQAHQDREISHGQTFLVVYKSFVTILPFRPINSVFQKISNILLNTNLISYAVDSFEFTAGRPG